MAKRVTRSKSPAAAVAAQLVPQVLSVRHGDPDNPIDANVAIDINDVVAIASTRAADFMEEQRAQAEKELVARQKELDAMTAKVQQAVLSAGRSLYSGRAAAIAAALTNFLGIPHEVRIDHLSLDLSPASDDGDDANDDPPQVGFVKITIGAWSEKQRVSGSQYLEFPRTVPASAVSGLIADWREAQQQLAQATERLLQIRAGIAKLPLLEKRWRSDLAETKLRSSETGRRIVEQLIASVPDRVLKLTQQK